MFDIRVGSIRGPRSAPALAVEAQAARRREDEK